MLDEPTASLDLCHQLDLLAIIKRRSEQGTTVITVMHDLNLAVLFARRVAALAHGTIAREGPSDVTIQDDMLRNAFGVANAVNRAPCDLPFVLPHQAIKAARPMP